MVIEIQHEHFDDENEAFISVNFEEDCGCDYNTRCDLHKKPKLCSDLTCGAYATRMSHYCMFHQQNI